jgi:integrase
MIYKRGKSGIYSYRFRFAGRMIHESARTKSKTLAREAERQRRRELEQRINNVKKRGLPPTFERAAREWQDSRGEIAEKTASIARVALKHLLPAFGPKLLCDITPQHIADYQRVRLQSGAQGRTVNIEVSTLRQILKAHDLWLPVAGKVRMLRERKDVAKALTPEQERSLIAATAESDSACHTATVLALNTAMRKDEIRLLRWGQIDLEKRTLTVGRSKTEAGAGRLITVNVPAFGALVRWAGRFPSVKPGDYVFPWCENKQVDLTQPTKGWRTAWRTALKRAGFQCRFHDLRVTCITKLAESQASDQTILSIAGHVSRKMLEHYSRIRVEAKRAALDAIAQPIFEAGVHQNVHQIQPGDSSASAN